MSNLCIFKFYREHLGMQGIKLPIEKLLDPSCEAFYKEIWLKTAAKNTQIFDEVSDGFFGIFKIRTKSIFLCVEEVCITHILYAILTR